MPDFEIHSKGGRRLNWPSLEIARNQYPHLSINHKFGASTSLTTTYAPLSVGNVYQTPQSTGATLEAVSSSTNDSTSGTGAWKLTVVGTSTAWEEISEEVTLSGTTPVALTNTYTRVYRTFVSESGSYATATTGSHTGAISVQGTGAGVLWARINDTFVSRGQSQIGIATIPAGKTAYVFLHFVSVDSNKTADFIFLQRKNADETSAPYTAMRMIGEYVGITGMRPFVDSSIPEGPFNGPCDIGFMAKAAATAEVSAEFEILLVDNGG